MEAELKVGPSVRQSTSSIPEVVLGGGTKGRIVGKDLDSSLELLDCRDEGHDLSVGVDVTNGRLHCFLLDMIL
jgi:hypothetical protein